jgi:hypothetical protein
MERRVLADIRSKREVGAEQRTEMYSGHVLGLLSYNGHVCMQA